MSFSSIVFYLSGVTLASLFILKNLENKRKTKFYVLEFISRGDKRVRYLYRDVTYIYLEGKERIMFFFKKQIPLHTKNGVNKLRQAIKEQVERRIGNIRRSKLLKKSDGLSEFFKSISEVEKGNGEINDIFEGSSQESENTLK